MHDQQPGGLDYVTAVTSPNAFRPIGCHPGVKEYLDSATGLYLYFLTIRVWVYSECSYHYLVIYFRLFKMILYIIYCTQCESSLSPINSVIP